MSVRDRSSRIVIQPKQLALITAEDNMPSSTSKTSGKWHTYRGNVGFGIPRSWLAAEADLGTFQHVQPNWGHDRTENVTQRYDIFGLWGAPYGVLCHLNVDLMQNDIIIMFRGLCTPHYEIWNVRRCSCCKLWQVFVHSENLSGGFHSINLTLNPVSESWKKSAPKYITVGLWATVYSSTKFHRNPIKALE